MRFYSALGLFVRLTVGLTGACVLLVFLGPSEGVLSTVLLPALAGAILGAYTIATRHSAWFGTAASILLLAWVVAVMTAVSLVALFVHSKNGQLESEYIADLGRYSLRAILLGAGVGLTTLFVAGRIARLLSPSEAA